MGAERFSQRMLFAFQLAVILQEAIAEINFFAVIIPCHFDHASFLGRALKSVAVSR